MPFNGALNGWSTVAGGWNARLVDGGLIGLKFTPIASRPLVRPPLETVMGSVLAGVVYAAAVGIVTSGVVLPIAMNAFGAETLPAPLVPFSGVLGGDFVVISVGFVHVVYGLVLGVTYGPHPPPSTGPGPAPDGSVRLVHRFFARQPAGRGRSRSVVPVPSTTISSPGGSSRPLSARDTCHL